MNGEIHLGYRYTTPPPIPPIRILISWFWEIDFFVFDIGSANYLSL